jgi:hypothetical protein
MWRRTGLRRRTFRSLGVSALVLAIVAAASLPAQVPGKPESKPATAKPKPSRRLPPLFANRFDVASAVKEFGGTRGSEDAVAAGLDWLARHQEPDGSWSCERFRNRCESEGFKCGGKGIPLYDVGVSSLALLAFLGAGNTESEGRHQDTVQRGLKWLKEQQDSKGCFGTTEDYRYPYMHAMGTTAMIENAILSGSTAARDSASRGIDYIAKIQSPQTRAWRYAEKPPDADSTVTAWMMLPLKAAQVAGYRSTDQLLRGASEFVKRVTDEKSFRTGYLVKGDLPFRFEAQMKRSPPAETESTTACGMAIRIFTGEEPRGTGAIRGQARVLLDKAPEWNPEAGRVDFFYWQFGTIAMFQLGGAEWQTWFQKLREAAIAGQQKGTPGESCQRGSWDPIDPWGTQGGRIYATAMMTLCLEGPYRYGRLFAAK